MGVEIFRVIWNMESEDINDFSDRLAGLGSSTIHWEFYLEIMTGQSSNMTLH